MLKVQNWLDCKKRKKTVKTCIEYLRNKILYWYYGKNNIKNARKFCRRFHYLLKWNFADSTILEELGDWALFYEVTGKVDKAIPYREQQLKVILRYLELISRRRERSIEKLQLARDIMDLLAINFYQVKRYADAIELLRNCKKFCLQHAVGFEGQELLVAFLRELRIRGKK